MQTETLESIDDLFIDSPPVDPPAILGRSELERWASCPQQAWHVEHRTVSNNSIDAEVGSAVHEIFASAVKSRSEDGATANILKEQITLGAERSRPDIQPRVIASVRRSAWMVANLICHHGNGADRAPEDLIRYDGGIGSHSGQIAADLYPDGADKPAIRLTCELDLLTAGESIEELDLWDWKAGRTWWTAGDVEDSFQFNFYAYLTMRNYPRVNRVNVRIVMSMEAKATSVVTFERQDMPAIEARILSAVRVWQQHSAVADPATVPAWPMPSKCDICPACLSCPLASMPAAEIGGDLEGSIGRLAVLNAATARVEGHLKANVKKSGGDLVYGKLAFGADWPRKTTTAGAMKVYQVGESET